MTDINSSLSDLSAQANEWKDKAAEKLNELKQQAGVASESIEQKASELWEDAKSGKLKEEATEKFEELKEKAHGLLDKLTGKD